MCACGYKHGELGGLRSSLLTGRKEAMFGTCQEMSWEKWRYARRVLCERWFRSMVEAPHKNVVSCVTD
jgi:hypothetical protein